MKKGKVFSFRYLVFDFIRVTAIPGLLWFRPKKYYLHEEDHHRIKGGALLISNHITLFDPMYLMLAIRSRRHHLICMDELFNNKKFKRWLFTKCFLCLPINRSQATFGQIKDIINNLKEGNLVSMFPEGKINDDKEGIQDFKSGMVMMASRGNAPIIPVYIKRRKHFYSRLEVAIGSPVDVSKFKSGASLTREETIAACHYLEEREKELEAFILKGEKK